MFLEKLVQYSLVCLLFYTAPYLHAFLPLLWYLRVCVKSVAIQHFCNRRKGEGRVICQSMYLYLQFKWNLIAFMLQLCQ